MVEEIVLMGRTARAAVFAAPSPRNQTAAREALDLMCVAHLAVRPYTIISGGERQLCLIARMRAGADDRRRR